MKLWRNRLLLFCALISVSALGAFGQDDELEAVRPSGISGPVRKAEPVKSISDSTDEEAIPKAKPARKASAAKSTSARSRKKQTKAKRSPASTEAPIEYTSDGIPKTGAASVIVVDANTG